MTFSDFLEIASSVVFLIIGLWATAYAYGLAGDRLFGRLRWNVALRQRLRWLGPLLVVLSVGAMFVILR